MAQKIKNFLITIPHSGEQIPDGFSFLKTLPMATQLRDVDRFVDDLYSPVLKDLNLNAITTQWHRYAADLNRSPKDVDQSSVHGATLLAGQMSRGFHWVKTTLGEPLLPQPLSQEQHQKMIELAYVPFHEKIASQVKDLKTRGYQNCYHLDLHSMPSLGTSEHRDPGQMRADIVISDQHQASASIDFVNLVITSYVRAGFKVGYNWPYYGGRITEQYGDPSKGHHTVQVELNRSLYMDEETKDKNPHYSDVQKKLALAISLVAEGIEKLPQ